MSKDNRKLLFVLMIVLVIGFAVKGIMEGTKMENIEISQEEKMILLAAGAEEKNIDNGILSGTQHKLLKVYKEARVFIDARYPDEDLLFVGLDNTSPRGQTYFFTAVEREKPNETFTVKVETERGNPETFTITESHYADMKRDEMAAIIVDVLAGMGVDATCDVEIAGLYSTEYDPRETLKVSLERGLPIDVTGWVFVNASVDLETVKAGIERKLCTLGISGGFSMRAVEGIALQEAADRPRTDNSFVVDERFVSLPAKASEVK